MVDSTRISKSGDYKDWTDQQLIDALGGSTWVDYNQQHALSQQLIAGECGLSTENILAALGPSWQNPNLYAGKRGVDVKKED